MQDTQDVIQVGDLCHTGEYHVYEVVDIQVDPSGDSSRDVLTVLPIAPCQFGEQEGEAVQYYRSSLYVGDPTDIDRRGGAPC